MQSLVKDLKVSNVLNWRSTASCAAVVAAGTASTPAAASPGMAVIVWPVLWPGLFHTWHGGLLHTRSSHAEC
jgi:hypothetical protein